jgi:hypothetical protein
MADLEAQIAYQQLEQAYGGLSQSLSITSGT